jgi:competence protein ComEA
VKHGVAGTTRTRRLLFVALTIAISWMAGGCVKRSYKPEDFANAATREPGASTATNSPSDSKSQLRININTASADELEKLPGIGMGLAERIIEHREKFGPFRRPEHLIIVRGISDKRFRALQDLITVK